MKTLKKKARIQPVPIIFLLVVCAAAGVLIAKGISFGLQKYDDYWRDNNIAYGTDLRFFGVKSIDQDKKPDDADLEDRVLKLLYAHINGEDAQSCGADIQISDEYFEMLDPNYNITKSIDKWCSLRSFLVVQKGDKAIAAFDYSIVHETTQHAKDYCTGTFKNRPCSRMYLERSGSGWTVTDVLIVG